ncbi:ATP-dependent helicase [Dongia sp.]|uniref:ATP-dependent helicase n=1 Tax=Dongia sp. TaxID=1977262 RepID=UPI0035B1C026
MEPAYLATLNTNQRRAVEHELVGGSPLLLIAGAGSGKTKTLSHRVGHLIANGVDPARIMLLTFTRRAAQELVSRAQSVSAGVMRSSNVELPWAGTFHSIGAKVLREYADQIGLNRQFTVMDREDSADLMDLVRHDLDMHLSTRRFPQKSTCLSIYSRAVNSELSLEEVLDLAFPWCHQWSNELRDLFAAYVKAKQANASLDYDDLLEYWSQAMQVPELAQHLSNRLDHILVDEFQDTNSLQSNILLNLRPDGRGLVVVGDDAQAIYSFRSATVENILSFPDQFSPPAAVITLDRNYRSTRPILAASNIVIGGAKKRFTKDLWSDRASAQKPLLVSVEDATEQAQYVAERVLELREAGVSLQQQAILFRASHHSAALELELTKRNIPFIKFGGLKFLDTKHVKDLLGVLRFVENPRDKVAAFRTFQLLPGIGPKAAGRAYAFITDYAAPLHRIGEFKPPASANEGWTALSELVTGLGASTWPSELDRIRRWYAPILEAEHDDASARMADLAQLCDIAAGYPSRSRFLTDLALDPPDATSDEAGKPLKDEEYVTLSTVHSAKGREWRSVFVLNVTDGCFPIDLGAGTEAEIEEERRLLYVAMTRAKDDLALILPQRWYVHGQQALGSRHVYAGRTRFITNQMLDHFEQRSWTSSSRSLDRSQVLPPQIIDISARLRERWK